MTRNAASDKAAFEEVLSEAFGKDMEGWTRYSRYQESDPDEVGLTTRLVIDVDASGKPLPPPGKRPEGYTIGGVLIISITETEYLGRLTPLVQINAWNPVNRRLMDTGHSKPSALEIDSMTFGDPDWQSKPELVDRVRSEVETDLSDAMADAINQLTGGSGFPSAYVERVDPWEDSRGFPDELGIVVPAVPNPDADIPPDIHEATPWVPDDVHEVTPWVPDDVHEVTPWEPEASDPSSGPDPDGGADDDSDTDTDASEMESWPGQAAYLEELEQAGPPTESTPIEEIGTDAESADSNQQTEPADDAAGGGISTVVKVLAGLAVVAIVVIVAAVIATTSGGSDTAAPATSSTAVTSQDDDTAATTTSQPEADTASPEAEPSGEVVPDDVPVVLAIPQRDPDSVEAPSSDGPTAAEILELPAPEGTTTDDEQRPGGGSLWVDAVYVVDWQADIVLDNARITPGGLFPPGSGWTGEYLILADCSGTECVYTTPLANGDDLVLEREGRTLQGTAVDTSGQCVRDIFIAFKVSDFQTINGRLVPDALRGARIETGTCETPVYREITYDGGFRFVGSYSDQ